MSMYTTGEVARLCGVTVRTVQYYDTRGILVPSELTDGGRRLYSEEDLKRMKIICFLRELGLPIDSISQLLSEENPGSVITLLLDQQEEALKEEIGERQEKLDKLDALKKEMRSLEHFTVESIGDIAYRMSNKNELKRIHRNMLLASVPFGILEWCGILLWIFSGIWQPFLVYAVLAVPFVILLFRYYFRHVRFICPECHTVFKPKTREAFFAAHTPYTRKLTCTACGRHGFCVETAKEKETETE